MAHNDKEADDILQPAQHVEPEQIISPERLQFRPDEPAVEEPWLSDVMAVLDSADGMQRSTPLPIGMKPASILLFQGPPKCPCCINWVTEQPDDIEEIPEVTDEIKQHAVLVRRKARHRSSPQSVEVDSIVVNSPLIRAALEEIFIDRPGIDLEAAAWTFQAPFELFFHYWDELNGLIVPGDCDTSLHMEVLVRVLSPVLEGSLNLSKSLVSDGLITFELIWSIFRPGQIVYCRATREDDAERLLVLEASQYDSAIYGLRDRYSLTCMMVDWDGNSFGRVVVRLQVDRFVGFKRITELPVYPLKIRKDRIAVESRFLQRGRHFEELAGVRYVAYRGIAKCQRRLEIAEGCDAQVLLDERIMIDTSSYIRETGTWNRMDFHPLNPVSKRQLSKYCRPDESANEDDGFPKGTLSDSQRINCSPWVKGYSFKGKQWVSVLVDGVTDICWNSNAFNNLVLDQRHKGLIRGFVQSHVKRVESFDDFIDRKGRGIVMLLVGPPGVGKTLTAEAIAENLHAPLYSLSAGQLGLDTNSIEGKLLEVLQLCKMWGAVLLLDEADVFLEQRTIHDLERNRLVSIFLRTLEYFEGVLFLTTNRLSDFDTAFESRIDFTLHFPDLDYQSRLCIWKNLFAKVGLPVNLQDADYEELARTKMNGRRIKNIIKSAAVIAGNEEGSAVQRTHVDAILEAFAPKS